jgi:hypothetical protein
LRLCALTEPGRDLSRQGRRAASALEDPAIRDEALHILRGLFERIVIMPAAEGPGETIELVGAIARMVELGNKKAALDARTACSVKVVAGARFGRYFPLVSARDLERTMPFQPHAKVESTSVPTSSGS